MREDADWIYFETYGERKAALPFTTEDQFFGLSEEWQSVPVGNALFVPRNLIIRRPKPPESQHFI